MSFEGGERRHVVREARSWVGTPYHPQGDIRGIGVDCGMLLVRVFVDTGLCRPFDPRPYADDWYLHRAEERYLGFIFDRAKEVTTPLPGDVMVFRYGRCFSHGGIVTIASPLTIVHAFQPALAVLEEEVARCPALCARAAAEIFQPLGEGAPMGFLRQSSNPSVVWKYTGLQIQTSSNTIPITILYGTNRLAPNAIWTGGFYAIPNYQKGGGKGGGQGQLQSYTYYTSFLMGLCEGPINNYITTFLNQQYLFGYTDRD
jgi:hypothetical protein